jgi:hypothetical protein
MSIFSKSHKKLLLIEDFSDFYWLVLPVATIVAPIIQYGSTPMQLLDTNQGLILREYAFNMILWSAIAITAFRMANYTERDTRREEWLYAGGMKWQNLWANYFTCISINLIVHLSLCWGLISVAAIILGGTPEIAKQITWIPNMGIIFGASLCAAGIGAIIQKVTNSGKVAAAGVVICALLGTFIRFTSENLAVNFPVINDLIQTTVYTLVPHIEWVQTLAFIRNYATPDLPIYLWVATTLQMSLQGCLLVLIAWLLPTHKNHPQKRFKIVNGK